MNPNQYKIPWIKVILVVVFALAVLFIIATPAIVLFIGIINHYPAIIISSLILMLAFGVIFFIKIQFWTNAMFYPVRHWIYKNVRCVECGQPLTKCEYTMEHPGALASFICYCRNCKKASLLETGTFNRTLAFKTGSLIEPLYEKKYHGEVYRIPLGIWILSLFPPLIFALGLFFLLVGIPILIYLHYFGPSKEAAAKFRSVKPVLWFAMLILISVIHSRFKIVRNFIMYPMRWWISRKVMCPICKGPITNCQTNVPESFFLPFEHTFIVYCECCKEQRTMKIGGFDGLLRFIDLHYEKYREKKKNINIKS